MSSCVAGPNVSRPTPENKRYRVSEASLKQSSASTMREPAARTKLAVNSHWMARSILWCPSKTIAKNLIRHFYSSWLGFTEAHYHSPSHFLWITASISHSGHHILHHGRHHLRHHLRHSLCSEGYEEATRDCARSGSKYITPSVRTDIAHFRMFLSEGTVILNQI